MEEFEDRYGILELIAAQSSEESLNNLNSRNMSGDIDKKKEQPFKYKIKLQRRDKQFLKQGKF